MNWREFITLLGGAAAAWPLAAYAQQTGAPPHIVIWLSGVATDTVAEQNEVAFKNTMRDLGWVDGGSVRIEGARRYGLFPERRRCKPPRPSLWP